MSEFNPSQNNVSPMVGVTNNAALTPTALRVDPTTKRLLVDAQLTAETIVVETGGVYNATLPTMVDGTQGELQLDVNGRLIVSATGTTDNSAFTAGTSTGTPALGFYHSTIDTVTDGRAATLAIDSKRNLFNVIRDAAGNARGANVDANNNLGVVLAAETTKVLGVVRNADGSGNLLVNIGADADGGSNTLNALKVSNYAHGFNGTTWDRLVSDTDSSDAMATSAQGIQRVMAHPMVWNGTTWDRFKSITNATNSTGTGIAAVGNVAQFDDVGPTAITENQFGNLRMSANRNAYTTLRDAAGNERGANVTASNELLVNVNNTVTVGTHAVTQSGTWTDRIVGNGGATLDSTVGAGTAPTNQVVVGALYNSTEISPTTGQAFALQADSKGRIRQVIMDAAGNTRGVNVDSSNRLSVTVDNIAGSLTLGTITTVGTVTTVTTVSASRTVGNGGAVLDAVNTAATAPANGLLTLGIYNSTEPSPSTGQSVGIQLDSKGRARQVIMDAAGNTRGANVDANNNLGIVLPAETTKVIGTVRNLGNGGATLDAVVGAGTAPANMVAVGGLYNSTEISPTTGQSSALQLDSKGRLRQVIMDAAGNTRGANVTASNELLVSVNNATLAVTESGTWTVGSSTATGSAVPANAFYMGGNAATALPTAATGGNLTGIMTDKYARQVAVLGTVRELRGNQTTTLSNTTSETTIVTAGAAGVFNDIIMITIANTSAATNTRIDFRDATAGTIIFSLQAPGNQTTGFAIAGETWPQTAAANNWTAQCATGTTDIRIAVLFEKNK